MQIFRKKEKSQTELEFEKMKGKPKKEMLEYFVKKTLEQFKMDDMSFLYISNPNQADVFGIKVAKNKSISFNFLQDIGEDYGVQSISITEDGCLFIQFKPF